MMIYVAQRSASRRTLDYNKKRTTRQSTGSLWRCVSAAPLQRGLSLWISLRQPPSSEYNHGLSTGTSPHMRADLWQRGCERLAAELPDQQFNTWIRPLPEAEVADLGDAGRSEEHTSELQSPCN